MPPDRRDRRDRALARLSAGLPAAFCRSWSLVMLLGLRPFLYDKRTPPRRPLSAGRFPFWASLAWRPTRVVPPSNRTFWAGPPAKPIRRAPDRPANLLEGRAPASARRVGRGPAAKAGCQAGLPYQ